MCTSIPEWRYRELVATIPAVSPTPVRRRPKDRKAQVERAAAEAFSASGYHAVGMETIAAKVGISAAALYRHYPSKYDLFRGAVLNLGQQLVDATDIGDEPQSGPDTLHRLIHALIDVTLANRDSGGLYRWQARYLRPQDQKQLMDQLRVVNRRIQKPLMAIRPTLSSSQRWMTSAALLSVIGSVVDHRVKMLAEEIRALLVDVSLKLLSAQLPAPDDPVLNPPRRQLFSGKSDILATVMRRAADQISGELSVILGADADPHRVLIRLVEAYVATSFANPELAFVYYTERVNLAPADEAPLRNVQQSTIDSWVR